MEEQSIVAEDALSIVLNHADPCPEDVSELLRRKASYGVAWLVLRSMKKGKITSQQKLKSLDLDNDLRKLKDSSNCKLSPGKVFLLLTALPKSIEELKFGHAAGFFPRGGSPFFCRFLETLADSEREGADVPCLKSLSFDDSQLEHAEVEQLFPLLPVTLEELDFAWNVSLVVDGWAYLGARLKSLERLKKLKFKFSSLNDAEAKELFPSLPAALEHLDFGHNRELGVAGWAALGSRLKGLERLKRLNVSNCGLRVETAEQLFPSLPVTLEELYVHWQFDLKSPGWALLRARLKSLKRLNKLSCSELQDEDLRELLPVLPATLEELNLLGNKRIGIVGSASLGERLKSLEGLKRLGLRDCTLTNDKVEQFFPSIPLALEDLDLAENPRIGPEGWASLGARLQSLEQLKKLNLNSCTLYDQKVESLFPSLPTTLEELSVRGGAHLCKAGWLALGARMKSLKHLKKLDLSTCAYLLSFTSTPVLPHLYHLFPLLPDTLEEVDFHCNSSIGIAGWKSLGVRLKSLERLKKLNLSECALNDEIVEQLFPSLPALLEELDIQGNSSIGIAGWKSLGASLKGLRRLKMLDLNDCGLKNLATEHEDVAKIAVHSAAHVGFCLNAQ